MGEGVLETITTRGSMSVEFFHCILFTWRAVYKYSTCLLGDKKANKNRSGASCNIYLTDSNNSLHVRLFSCKILAESRGVKFYSSMHGINWDEWSTKLGRQAYSVWRQLYSCEPREGWPLLTVETAVNGDSKSTNKRDPSWLARLSLSCRYKRFLVCLAAL
jgi:hypothetical protein